MNKSFTPQEKRRLRRILYELQDMVIDDGYGLGEAVDALVTKYNLID